MSESRLLDLLLHWEDARVRGENLTPEELCPDDPELAAELRRYIDGVDKIAGLGGVAAAATTVPPSPDTDPTRRFTVSVEVPGYEIYEELGRGGMGVVYKARHLKLNRVVALKMVLGGIQASPDLMLRFLQEAELAARLHHPNIVGVHEVGTHAGDPYLALEFVDGPTLSHKCGGTPQPPREAARLVEVLAAATHEAHLRGIVHRDLKPGNILLSFSRDAERSAVASTGDAPAPARFSEPRLNEFEPKIADFGLAKRVEADSGLTQTGAVVGTPAYMAPEQAQGKKDIGPAADVYALGAILYELLTGRPPFLGATHYETLTRVIAEEPLPVRAAQPAVPKDLETVCLKCLRKEPDKRYATARYLADDLARFLAGEAIHARPIGRTERLVKWARREPMVAGLIALVAFTLVLGTTVATVFGVLANNNARRADQEAKEATRLAGEEKKARKEAEEEAHKANVGRHGLQMTAAWQAWQQHDLVEAEALLDQVPVEFQQGWEYRHVRALCRRKALPLKGHTGFVFSVAYSPDGKRIVSGSDDKTVKVWDAATGQDLLTLKGHTDRVASVAYSPDGKRIVSGSHDKTVKVWDAATGQDLLTLKGHTNGVNSVAYSPDGKRILSGGFDATVKVWDAATGQELLTLKGHKDRITSVAYSPDGKRIVSSSGPWQNVSFHQWPSEVKGWDAATGQDLFTLKQPPNSLTSVAYSPDGKRIVSGCFDATVKVRDAATGQDLLILKGHIDSVLSVAYSPDGKRIVSGGFDMRLKVWDAATGQELFTLKGHTNSLTSVAYSPDGKRIASGSYDGTVKLWDATTGQDLLTLKGHAGFVYSVACSPNGKRIVSGSADWWISDRGAPWRIARPSEVKVWDAATGQDLLTLKGHTDRVTSVAYSPDGKRIVSGSEDKMLKVWNAATGQELLSLKGHATGVSSVAYSPDGKRIVSGGGYATLKVWDAATGQDLLTLKGHTGFVSGVAYSPDGQRIVSGNWDKTVKVWDATKGQDLLTLNGHTDSVNSVTFSPDGKRILGRDTAGTILAWDATSGRLLPDAPAAMAAGSMSVAVFRDLRARVDGPVIRLERILSPDEQRQEERIESILCARATLEFHAVEAEVAENNHQPFAAVFHLDRLLSLLPDQRDKLLARRNAVLVAARKQDANDVWAVRTLARQAISNPDSVPDRKTLLPRLAALAKQHNDAPTHRLHGGLLLRCGSAQEAIAALQAAMAKRDRDAPPVEELLLSLAHVELKQPAEARKHWQAAVAWIQRGNLPVQATSLTGLVSRGPLACLGSLAVALPPPPLNPFDHQTAHELKTLRAEVEKTLTEPARR